MNNRSEILAGYKPRVSIYPKTHASGKVNYYVSYYLPGVKRKVARPLYCKKSEAKELMFIHERRLRNHQFDDFDLQRIPEIYQLELNTPRVQIMDALERYMMATSYNRRPSTNRNFCEKLKNEDLLKNPTTGRSDEISREFGGNHLFLSGAYGKLLQLACKGCSSI